jgi:hypothetical protein
MDRLTAALLMIILTVPGCNPLSLLVDDLDPPCQGRPDAPECQAALQAVRIQYAFAFELERHAVRVDPVECDQEGCSTLVHVIPPPDECLPMWSFMASRSLAGPWQPGASLHGDPDCDLWE